MKNDKSKCGNHFSKSFGWRLKVVLDKEHGDNELTPRVKE